jgi:membrane protein
MGPIAAAMFGILAIIVLKRSFTQNNKKPPGASRRNASPATLAAETDDRGRNGRSPSEISAKGWKVILLRVYAN